MSTYRAPGSRRLAAIFDRAREPVFVLGSSGELLYANPAWERLTGRELNSGSGPGTSEETSFRPPPEAFAGTPCGGPALIETPQGLRDWFRVEYWPFRDEPGEVIGFLGMVRDSRATPSVPDSESCRASVELAQARESMRLRYGDATMIGRGARHDRFLEQMATATRVSVPVTIVGEPGTGRRLAARVIHQNSGSRDSRFVIIDAPALTSGALDQAVMTDHRGTVMVIHEPEQMPRDMQAKLASIPPDVRPRLIAITTIDPEVSMAEGLLREDLGFALSTLVLRLPALRDRIDEIPLLAQHFLERSNRGKRSCERDALDVLAQYDWPGNIAELERVILAACVRSTGDRVTVADLPAEIKGELAAAYEPPAADPGVTPLDVWLARLEMRMIERALVKARRNKSRAAELLSISRPRLYRRMKELGIEDEGEPAEHGDSAEPG